MKVSMIATKRVRVNGRVTLPGQSFEAQARDARVLAAIGKAQRSDVAVTPVATSVVAASAPIEATQQATVVAEESEEAAPSPAAAGKPRQVAKEAPRPRRRYTRRDMKAEK